MMSMYKQSLFIRNLLLMGVTGLFVACGASMVEVSGSYPVPNVNKVPISLAVYYDDALRDFIYTEFSETGQEEYNILSGQSHVDLFNAVLPAMFQQVVEVGSMEEAAILDVDAVFAPTIEEFQLALPYKTKLEVFEVWIKYNMRLVSPEGDYIADWVTTSYGKTEDRSLTSNESSINEAAYEALRDLGSTFVLSFDQVPEVRDWLASR